MATPSKTTTKISTTRKATQAQAPKATSKPVAKSTKPVAGKPAPAPIKKGKPQPVVIKKATGPSYFAAGKDAEAAAARKAELTVTKLDESKWTPLHQIAAEIKEAYDIPLGRLVKAFGSERALGEPLTPDFEPRWYNGKWWISRKVLSPANIAKLQAAGRQPKAEKPAPAPKGKAAAKPAPKAAAKKPAPKPSAEDAVGPVRGTKTGKKAPVKVAATPIGRSNPAKKGTVIIGGQPVSGEALEAKRAVVKATYAKVRQQMAGEEEV